MALGRDDWSPPEPFGPDGWLFLRKDHNQSVIITAADYGDGIVWVHASMAGDPPSYDDLVLLHRAVFGDGYAYQVFAPRDKHVNIHSTALHLWGRLDGKPVLPEFGVLGNGSI
jgi:hypothetical protein